MTRLEYPIVVEPLPIEEGGGFLATVPDLPGCMSDGTAPEEAVSNIQDAITRRHAISDMANDRSG